MTDLVEQEKADHDGLGTQTDTVWSFLRAQRKLKYKLAEKAVPAEKF